MKTKTAEVSRGGSAMFVRSGGGGWKAAVGGRGGASAVRDLWWGKSSDRETKEGAVRLYFRADPVILYFGIRGGVPSIVPYFKSALVSAIENLNLP